MFTNGLGINTSYVAAFDVRSYRSSDSAGLWPATATVIARETSYGLVWVPAGVFGSSFFYPLLVTRVLYCIYSIPFSIAADALAAGLCGSSGGADGFRESARFGSLGSLALGAAPRRLGAPPFVYVADVGGGNIRSCTMSLWNRGLGPSIDLDVRSLTSVIGLSGAIVVTADGNVLFAALVNLKVVRISPLRLGLDLTIEVHAFISVFPGVVRDFSLHSNLATEDDLLAVVTIGSSPFLSVFQRDDSNPTPIVTQLGSLTNGTLPFTWPNAVSILSDGAVLLGNGLSEGVAAMCPNTVLRAWTLQQTVTVGNHTFTLRREAAWSPVSVDAAAAVCNAANESLASIDSAAEQAAALSLVSQRGIGSPFVLIGAFANGSTNWSWLWIDGNRRFANATTGVCDSDAFCGATGGRLEPVVADNITWWGGYVVGLRTTSHRGGSPGTWDALSWMQQGVLWGAYGTAMGAFLCRAGPLPLAASCRIVEDCNGLATSVRGVVGSCVCSCLSRFAGDSCDRCSADRTESSYPTCGAVACTLADRNCTSGMIRGIFPNCTCGCLPQHSGMLCETCTKGFEVGGWPSCQRSLLDNNDPSVNCTTSRACNGHALTATFGRGSCVCTCNRRYSGVTCNECSANYAVGNYPVCNARACSRDADCSSGGNATGTFPTCVCNCDERFAGLSCDMCHPQFAFGGYPTCRAASASGGRNCSVAFDCQGRADAVTGVEGSCNCTCNSGYSGPTCAVQRECSLARDCPGGGALSVFWAHARCLCRCSVNHFGPRCTPRGCINELDCNNRAVQVIGETYPYCICACRPEYEGAMCETLVPFGQAAAPCERMCAYVWVMGVVAGAATIFGLSMCYVQFSGFCCRPPLGSVTAHTNPPPTDVEMLARQPSLPSQPPLTPNAQAVEL